MRDDVALRLVMIACAVLALLVCYHEACLQ